MKQYINAFSSILVFTFIFTGFSGVVLADKGGSSSSVSSIKTTSVPSSSFSINSSASRIKPFSLGSSLQSSAFSGLQNISSRPDISNQLSVPESFSKKEPRSIPVPFVIAADKKNNVQYNTLVTVVKNTYTKIAAQPQTPVIEKDFPFSRPIHISLPVTRGGSVYWFGGKTYNQQLGGYFAMPSNTATSTSMQTWNTSTTNDPWEGRTESAGVYFQGKMYMVSGWGTSSEGCSPDVWSSVNGKGWNLSATMPAWGQGSLGGRYGHTLVVMGTKMYLIGGLSCTNQQGFGDVWVTGDGENWTQLTTNNPVIGPRFDHTAVVLNNKIYVMGGFKNCDNSQGTCGYRNDVISSSDGINWQVVNNHAPWLRRSGHMSFVSGTKMYVLGGYSYTIPQLGNSSNVWIDPETSNLILTSPNGESFPVQPGYYNDVWSSTDGVTWTQKTSQAEWIWRRDATGFSIGSTMYVFGGTSEQTYTGFRNDAWKSIDGGIHWQQTSMGPQSHSSVVGHTAIVVPKNFGATVFGSKPSPQILKNGLFAQLGLVNLRAYVTSDLYPTTAWFEYVPATGYGAFLPYSNTQTVQQLVALGLNTPVTQTVTFPENTNHAIRIVAKNIVGTAISEGMNVTVPNCASGTPYIWLMAPIGAEIISGLGGETFYQNTTMTVTWGSCNLSSDQTISIRLARQGSPDMFYFTSQNDGSETIQLTTSNPNIWTGNYIIRVSNPATGYSQSGLVQIVQ